MALATQKEQDKRMREEVTIFKKKINKNSKRIDNSLKAQAQFDTTVKDQRMKRLKFLLEKSGAYATILGSKLAKQQEEAREKAAQRDAAAAAAASATTPTAVETAESEKRAAETPARTRKTRGSAANKRKTTDANYQLDEYLKEDVSIHQYVFVYFLVLTHFLVSPGREKTQTGGWQCQ